MENTNRTELVGKLKEKVLAEINFEKTKAKQIMLGLKMNEYESWDYVAERYFNLVQLEKYVSSDAAFMQRPHYGASTFIVSERHLTMWLDEKYEFALNFSFAAEEFEHKGRPVQSALNDRYFEYEFVSVLEEALYDQEREK